MLFMQLWGKSESPPIEPSINVVQFQPKIKYCRAGTEIKTSVSLTAPPVLCFCSFPAATKLFWIGKRNLTKRGVCDKRHLRPAGFQVLEGENFPVPYACDVMEIDKPPHFTHNKFKTYLLIMALKNMRRIFNAQYNAECR